MPIELEAKVWRMKNSLLMVIPKPVVQALQLKEGDTLLVSLNDSTMMVRRKEG
ncbi:MAG: AbrB/MazE/SpoVT family DNA-binding domain-containing protein [Candidatus Methanomethyliaceae archaeon]